MVNWFMAGGPFMWFILLIFVAELFIAWRGYAKINANALNKAALDLKTLLILGVSALSVGVVGQLMGIYAALGAIIVATDISPAIVLEGFRIASISSLFGMAIFLITLVVWFGLREFLYRRTD